MVYHKEKEEVKKQEHISRQEIAEKNTHGLLYAIKYSAKFLNYIQQH
jgi:hypothetical protein